MHWINLLKLLLHNKMKCQTLNETDLVICVIYFYVLSCENCMGTDPNCFKCTILWDCCSLIYIFKIFSLVYVVFNGE